MTFRAARPSETRADLIAQIERAHPTHLAGMPGQLGPEALDGWEFTVVAFDKDPGVLFGTPRLGGLPGRYVLRLFEGRDDGPFEAWIEGAPAAGPTAMAQVAAAEGVREGVAKPVARLAAIALVIGVLAYILS